MHSVSETARDILPNRRVIWLPTGGHMGDAIMILSLFAEALRADPSIRISYVVRRNAGLITGLASKYPQIEIVPVPRTLWGSVRAVLPLFGHRAIVIAPPAWDVHPKVVKLLALLFRLRGDTVIGFEDHTRVQPWHIAIDYEKHTERYIDGLRRAFRACEIPVAAPGTPPSLELEAELPPVFPFAGKLYVVIHPFPNMATTKTLPWKRWRELILWLREAHPDIGVVITGAEVDRSLAEAISRGQTGIYLDIQTPIKYCVGLIAHARAYIGVDTGPTHIAGVLQAPSVVITQMNSPAWLADYNPRATLLWSKKECLCGVPGKNCIVTDPEAGTMHRRCVYFVTDDEIHAAVEHLL